MSDRARQYGWLETNRLRGYGGWEDEIEAMEELGYGLIPPEYYIPDHLEKLMVGDEYPKIYTLRVNGPGEVTTNFGCYAAEVGYPLFFKKEP